MPINLTSSSTWESVIWNGSTPIELDKIIYNGTVIWEKDKLSSLLQDFTYTYNKDSKEVDITGWKGTYKGVSSTICYLPAVDSELSVNIDNLNYRQYSNITNIVIEEAVNITNDNFYGKFMGLEALTSVNIPIDKISNLSSAFESCTSLTGPPVCGSNVTDMSRAYFGCTNLTGPVICGPNICYMDWAFCGCTNLTGPIIMYTDNSTDRYSFQSITNAFSDCINLEGNVYFYHNETNVYRCFDNINVEGKRFNIYVHEESSTLFECLGSDTFHDEAQNLTWDDTSGAYTDRFGSFYLYPVANVEAARLANGD